MSEQPQRIQRRRTKGWRTPPGAVYVGRPTRWANPYVVGTISDHRAARYGLGDDVVVRVVGRRDQPSRPQWAGFGDRAEAAAFAVDLYRRALLAVWADVDGALYRADYLDGLAGRDLVCWCPPGWPCHADVLLDLANPDQETRT